MRVALHPMTTLAVPHRGTASGAFAAPPGDGSSAPSRRSFQASALTRRDGRLFVLQATVDRTGPGEAPLSIKHGLIRDLSARTTAERLVAAALRKFLADGAPPSRAAIERAFAETQDAVEKGVRLALRFLRDGGAGSEALEGAAEAAMEVREALARWRAESLARAGG